MSFFQILQDETALERAQLLDNPLVHRAIAGDLSEQQYVAFLCQAYHHVKHTVPLLMAAGSRVPQEHEWLRNALAEYVEEELGHQEWILNDIAACGYDKEKARSSRPNRETEMMVAYAYYVIDRVDPMGFFGMVHVLEGTSVTVADEAASCIARSTGLPKKAFSYLTSHGALDIEHVKFFENLMNKIDNPQHRELILHCARNFYHLYGGVYSSVAAEQAVSLAA
ncbi:MAG: iron-containing redox enzyme family protein [Proteobacteria bacterium]|nr:iron-containing redox enzyme family protein [Pseudomonadota bacterium]